MRTSESIPVVRPHINTGHCTSIAALLLALLTGIPATLQAQDHDHTAAPVVVDHSAHSEMPAGSADIIPVETLRDPHAYSNGLRMGEGPYAVGGPAMHMADDMLFGGLRVDRLEHVFRDGSDASVYDAWFWYGSSYDRLLIKAEGEFADNSFEGSETDVLWSHAISSFWDTQVGVRNQTGEGPDRNWLAVGMRGIAPYWLHVDITAYLGAGGRTALNIETEYEWLLTQRWVLQPRLEMNLYGKNDRARNVGSGLSDTAAGLRLKYQITRQIVPYIGVEEVRQYGDTARYSDHEEGSSDTRWVAGLRFWF